MSNLRALVQFADNSKITVGSGGSDTDTVHNLPTTSANDILINSLHIVYFVAGIVAVIIIIVAGFTYVTSAGDAVATAKAKNTIMYAIIGLILVILAFAITQFIIGRLG